MLKIFLARKPLVIAQQKKWFSLHTEKNLSSINGKRNCDSNLQDIVRVGGWRVSFIYQNLSNSSSKKRRNLPGTPGQNSKYDEQEEDQDFKSSSKSELSKKESRLEK